MGKKNTYFAFSQRTRVLLAVRPIIWANIRKTNCQMQEAQLANNHWLCDVNKTGHQVIWLWLNLLFHEMKVLMYNFMGCASQTRYQTRLGANNNKIRWKQHNYRVTSAGPPTEITWPPEKVQWRGSSPNHAVAYTRSIFSPSEPHVFAVVIALSPPLVVGIVHLFGSLNWLVITLSFGSKGSGCSLFSPLLSCIPCTLQSLARQGDWR